MMLLLGLGIGLLAGGMLGVLFMALIIGGKEK